MVMVTAEEVFRNSLQATFCTMSKTSWIAMECSAKERRYFCPLVRRPSFSELDGTVVLTYAPRESLRAHCLSLPSWKKESRKKKKNQAF